MKKIISISIVLILTVLSIWAWVASRETAPLTTEGGGAEHVQATTFTIIAFGDSLTAGYGLPLSESYPAQLEVRLREAGYRAKVINAGVSGETTKGNLERAPFIRDQNPDIVLIGIGGNDALRYLPVEETEKNMRAAIETFLTSKNPPSIILLRMQAPLNAGFAYKKSFDALYETLSDEYKITLVPFYTKEMFLNPEYKLDDGIHFNKAGYTKVIDDYILEAVEDILSQH